MEKMFLGAIFSKLTEKETRFEGHPLPIIIYNHNLDFYE